MNEQLEKKRKKLPVKQRRFIDELLADPDMEGKRAALKAGYSEKSAPVVAHRMQRDPVIKAIIDEEIEQRSQRTNIDKDYVVNQLVEVLQMSTGKMPIVHSKVGAKGVETSLVKKTNLQAANKAAELLGRHLGMFTDKVEHTEKASLGQTMADISKRNAENRKSLLPKDNIDFDAIDEDDDE